VEATLVDSNVILDILTEDLEWLDWSAAALAWQADAGPLVVNPPIHAEAAAFLAGRSFVRYGRKGGQRRSPLLSRPPHHCAMNRWETGSRGTTGPVGASRLTDPILGFLHKRC
jgi:hypothetical protein